MTVLPWQRRCLNKCVCVCVCSSMPRWIVRLLMLFRWCSLSSLVPWGSAILQLAWQKLDTNTLLIFWQSPALSALRVFKHHLSLVPSPPRSAPLVVPTPQIHFIDFKHLPVCLTPSLPLFRQTIQSRWYSPNLTEATTNRFLQPSINVKPSTWLLLSHQRTSSHL